MILYLFVFFFLLCFALVSPNLFAVLQDVPPGPEQKDAARRAAQEALAGKFWFPAAGAIAITALGAYRRWLPGLRGQDR